MLSDVLADLGNASVSRCGRWSSSHTQRWIPSGGESLRGSFARLGCSLGGKDDDTEMLM